MGLEEESTTCMAWWEFLVKEELDSLPPTKPLVMMLRVWHNGSPAYLFTGSFSQFGW